MKWILLHAGNTVGRLDSDNGLFLSSACGNSGLSKLRGRSPLVPIQYNNTMGICLKRYENIFGGSIRTRYENIVGGSIRTRYENIVGGSTRT